MAYIKDTQSLVTAYVLSGTALKFTKLLPADLIDVKIKVAVDDPNLERQVVAWLALTKNETDFQVSLQTLDGYDDNLLLVADYSESKELDLMLVSRYDQPIEIHDIEINPEKTTQFDYYYSETPMTRSVNVDDDIFFVSDNKFDSREGVVTEHQPTDASGRNEEHDLTDEEVGNIVQKTGATEQVIEGGIQFELAQRGLISLADKITAVGLDLMAKPLGLDPITKPFNIFVLPEGADYPQAILDEEYLKVIEVTAYQPEGEGDNSTLVFADPADVTWMESYYAANGSVGNRVQVWLNVPVDPRKGAATAQQIASIGDQRAVKEGKVFGYHAAGSERVRFSGLTDVPVVPGSQFRLGNGDDTLYTIKGGDGSAYLRITPTLQRNTRGNPSVWWVKPTVLKGIQPLINGVVIPTGAVAGGQTDVELVAQNSVVEGAYLWAHNGVRDFMHKVTAVDTAGSRPSVTLEPELQFDIDQDNYFVVVDKTLSSLVGKSMDTVVTKAMLKQYFIDNPIDIPDIPDPVDISGKADIAGQEVTGTYSYAYTDGTNNGWAVDSGQSPTEATSRTYVRTVLPEASAMATDVSMFTPPGSPVVKPLRFGEAGGLKPSLPFVVYAFQHPTLRESGKAHVRFAADAAGTQDLPMNQWAQLLPLLRAQGLIWSDAQYVPHENPGDFLPRETIEGLMDEKIAIHAAQTAAPTPDPDQGGQEETPTAPTIPDGSPENSGWKFDADIAGLATDPADVGYLPSLSAPAYALTFDELPNGPKAGAKAYPIRLSDKDGTQATTSFDFYLFASPSSVFAPTNPQVRFAKNEDGTGWLSQEEWDEIRPLIEDSALIWVRQPAQDTSSPQSVVPRKEIEEMDWDDHIDALKAASTRLKADGGDVATGELKLAGDGHISAGVYLMPEPMASYPDNIGSLYIEVMAQSLRYIDFPDRDGNIDIRGPQLKIGTSGSGKRGKSLTLLEGAFYMVGSRTMRSNKPNHFYVRLCTNSDGTGTIPSHLWADIVAALRTSGGEVAVLTFAQPTADPRSLLPREEVERMIADSTQSSNREVTAAGIGAVSIGGDVIDGPILAPRDTSWYATSWKNPDTGLDINDVLTYGFPTEGAQLRDLVMSTEEDGVPNGATLTKVFLRSSGSGDSLVALGDPVYVLVLASKTTDPTKPWIRLYKDAAGTTPLVTVDLQGAPFTSLQSGHPFTVERGGVDTSSKDALITRQDMEDAVSNLDSGPDLSDGGEITDTVTIRGGEPIATVTLADVAFFNAGSPTMDYYEVLGDFKTTVPEDIDPGVAPENGPAVAVRAVGSAFGADTPPETTPVYVWRKKGDTALNGNTKAYVRFSQDPAGNIGLTLSQWNALKLLGTPIQLWTAGTPVDTSHPRSLMPRDEIEAAIAEAVKNSGGDTGGGDTGGGDKPPAKPDQRLGIISGASGTEVSALQHGFTSNDELPATPFTMAVALNSYVSYQEALDDGATDVRQIEVTNAYLNGSTLKLAVSSSDAMWLSLTFAPFSGADAPDQPACWAQFTADTTPPPQLLKGVVSAELGNGRRRLGIVSYFDTGKIHVKTDVYSDSNLPEVPFKITLASNVYSDPSEHQVGELVKTIEVTEVAWSSDALVCTVDAADAAWADTWFDPKTLDDDTNAAGVWEDAGLDESKTALTLGNTAFLNLPGVGPAAFTLGGTLKSTSRGPDSASWASWTPRVLKPGTQMVIDGHKQIYRVADVNTDYGMFVVRPDLEREVKANTKFYLWEPKSHTEIDPTKPATIGDLLTDGQLMAAVDARATVANTAANFSANGNLIELNEAVGFAANGDYLIHYTPEAGLNLHKVVNQRNTGGDKVEFTVTPNRKVAMTVWDAVWRVPAADYGAIADLPYNTPITKAMLEKALADASSGGNGDIQSTGAINQKVEGGFMAETDGAYFGKSRVMSYPAQGEVLLGSQPLGDANLDGPFTVVFGSALVDSPEQILGASWRPELEFDSYVIDGSGAKLITSHPLDLNAIENLFSTGATQDGNLTWAWFKSGLNADKSLVNKQSLKTALAFGGDPNGHPGHVVTTNGIKHVINSAGILLAPGVDRTKLLQGSTFVRNDGDPTVYTIHSISDSDPCNVFFTPNLKRQLFGAINLHIRPPGVDKDNPLRSAVSSDLSLPQTLVDKVSDVLTTTSTSSQNSNILNVATVRGAAVGDYVLRQYAAGWMAHQISGVDGVSNPQTLTVSPNLPETIGMNQSYMLIPGASLDMSALPMNEVLTRATFEKWAAANAGGGGSDPDAVKKSGETNQEIDGGLVAAQGDVHFNRVPVTYFISSEEYLLPGHPLGEDEITDEFAIYIGSVLLDDPTKAIDTAFVRRVPCINYRTDGANCRVRLKLYADSQWVRTRFNTENGASDNDKAAFFFGIDVNTDNRLLSLTDLAALPVGRSPVKGMVDEGLALDAKPLGSDFMKFSVVPTRMPMPGSRVVFNNGDPTVYTIGGPSGDNKSFKISPVLVKAHRDGCKAYLLKVTPGTGEDLVSQAQLDYNAALDTHRLHDVYVDDECAAGQPVRMRNDYAPGAVGHFAYLNGANHKGLHRITAQSHSYPYTLTLDPPTTGAVLENEGVRIIDKAFADVVGLSLDSPVSLAMMEKYFSDNAVDTSAFMGTEGGQFQGWPLLPSVMGGNEGWKFDPSIAPTVYDSPTSNAFLTTGATGTAFQTGRWAEDGAPYRLGAPDSTVPDSAMDFDVYIYVKSGENSSLTPKVSLSRNADAMTVLSQAEWDVVAPLLKSGAKLYRMSDVTLDSIPDDAPVPKKLLASMSGGGGKTPGEIFIHSGPGTPAGAIPLGSAPVSRTTYADLFAAIGSQYGAGDGSSTFNLPPEPVALPGVAAGLAEIGASGIKESDLIMLNETEALAPSDADVKLYRVTFGADSVSAVLESTPPGVFAKDTWCKTSDPDLLAWCNAGESTGGAWLYKISTKEYTKISGYPGNSKAYRCCRGPLSPDHIWFWDIGQWKIYVYDVKLKYWLSPSGTSSFGISKDVTATPMVGDLTNAVAWVGMNDGLWKLAPGGQMTKAPGSPNAKINLIIPDATTGKVYVSVSNTMYLYNPADDSWADLGGAWTGKVWDTGALTPGGKMYVGVDRSLTSGVYYTEGEAKAKWFIQA